MLTGIHTQATMLWLLRPDRKHRPVMSHESGTLESLSEVKFLSQVPEQRNLFYSQGLEECRAPSCGEFLVIERMQDLHKGSGPEMYRKERPPQVVLVCGSVGVCAPLQIIGGTRGLSEGGKLAFRAKDRSPHLPRQVSSSR